MRPTRDLRRLARSASYRLKALRDSLDSARGGLTLRERTLVVCAVTIDATNTWSNFSRSYYLSCCVGTFLQPIGFVTSKVAFTGFNDSIGLAIRLYRSHATPRATGIWHRRDEPPWHDPNVLMKCCHNVGASNYPHVTNALSVGTRFFIDLPVFRNYCAHKNQQTENAAKKLAPNYGISALLSPLEILLSTPLRAREPLLTLWLFEMETVVRLLCE
jgi:hypothetical protein